MIFCPACGMQNYPGSTHCARCSTAFPNVGHAQAPQQPQQWQQPQQPQQPPQQQWQQPQQPQQPPQQQWQQPQQAPQQHAYQPQASQPMQPMQGSPMIASAATSAGPAKKSNTGLIIGIIVGVVLVGGGVTAAVVMSGGGGSKAKSEATASDGKETDKDEGSGSASGSATATASGSGSASGSAVATAGSGSSAVMSPKVGGDVASGGSIGKALGLALGGGLGAAPDGSDGSAGTAGTAEAVPAGNSPGAVALQELSAIRDQACTCKDADCATASQTTFDAWAQKYSDLQASQDEADQAGKIAEAYMECVVKAQSGGGDPAPAVAAESTGIPECDAYIASMIQYANCDKMPKESRESILQSVEQARGAWAQMSGMDDATKAEVGKGCQQGVDAMVESAQSIGCPMDATASGGGAVAAAEVGGGDADGSMPNCDAFVVVTKAIVACKKVPKSTRDSLEQSLDAMEKGMAQMKGIGAEYAKQMDDGCKQGVEGLQQVADAYHCKLPGA
jgi:hypothetical protein